MAWLKRHELVILGAVAVASGFVGLWYKEATAPLAPFAGTGGFWLVARAFWWIWVLPLVTALLVALYHVTHLRTLLSLAGLGVILAIALQLIWWPIGLFLIPTVALGVLAPLRLAANPLAGLGSSRPARG